MLQYRLRAYEHFMKRPLPTWTDGLDRINFDNIVYYRKPSEREEKSWDDVPEKIKQTFERLGIPEAERKFLSGVGAQYDSEVVYHSVREELTLTRKLGDEHPHLTHAVQHLADVLGREAKYAEAQILLHEDLARQRKLFGNGNPDAFTLQILGDMLRHSGQWTMDG